MAQVSGIQREKARRKVSQRLQRRHQAGVMQDHSLEMPGQPWPADQVVGDYGTQPQAQAGAMVGRQQAMAFDHDDIQAVMSVIEDAGVMAVEQLVEHALATLADLGHGHALGKTLCCVEFAQAPQAMCGIGQAGAGKAPGADGGANQ
ncbi:hypothetical protein D3C86_1371060 [compost metagenome]